LSLRSLHARFPLQLKSPSDIHPRSLRFWHRLRCHLRCRCLASIPDILWHSCFRERWTLGNHRRLNLHR
jgi:hypothetical protein